MDRWLTAALDYIPTWIDYQLEASQQPGCLLAVVQRGKVVLERGFGLANLATGEAMTPRHRFRIASHSKSFTAAGILKLREQKRVRLDDPVGTYITGLHRKVAETTIAQLLSHTAGLSRDGADSTYFSGRRPFPTAAALLKDLAQAPVLEPGVRVKYSNHGFGLLGLVIAAVTGEPYRDWIEREVVAAVGLTETTADAPLKRGTPFARGHSARMLAGRRLIAAGDESLHAIASAGGFVSTAADTALFFNQLAPGARHSLLSVASRREMVRRHWRLENSAQEGYYGLGTMSGSIGGWNWFGHSGGLFGYISRTITLPDHDLTLSILTNATDGWASVWVDGAVNILRTFASKGPPTRRVRDWTGRWWSSWGATDLVPMGDRVMAAAPALANHPFLEPGEIEVTGRDTGRLALAGSYGSHGEPVRRVRNAAGRVTELWGGPNRFISRARAAAELEKLYGKPPRQAGRTRSSRK